MVLDLLSMFLGLASGSGIHHWIANTKNIRLFLAKHERDRKELGERLDEAMTHMTVPGAAYTIMKAINDCRNIVDAYSKTEIGFIDRRVFLLSLPKIKETIDQVSDITTRRIRLLNVTCISGEDCNVIRAARRRPYIELMQDADQLASRIVERYENILKLGKRPIRDEDQLFREACMNFNNRDPSKSNSPRRDGGPERRRGYKNGPGEL